MLSKHESSFEFINDKIYNKLTPELKDGLNKYRRVRRDIIKDEKEVEKLKDKIQTKKTKIKRYNDIINHLYTKVEHLKSDWDPTVSFVTYNKVLRRTGNTSMYWNCNIKYRKQNCSIYLGSDTKLREYFIKSKSKRKSISKDDFKNEYLSYNLIDNIKDWCIDNVQDIFNNTPNFETLISYESKT